MNQATRKSLLKLVSDYYNKLASFEQTTSGKLPSLLTEELVSKIKNSERVIKILDIGSGRAGLLANLPEGVDYLGVDNCQELVTEARAKYANYPTARFEVADVLKLNELAEIGFDYVFSIKLMQHVPSAKLRLEALKQLKNKAKPGAKIYLQLDNLWASQSARRRLIKFTVLKIIGKHGMDWRDLLIDSHDEQGKLIGQNYCHAFTLKELKDLARQADLQVENLYSDGRFYHVVLKR